MAPVLFHDSTVSKQTDLSNKADRTNTELSTDVSVNLDNMQQEHTCMVKVSRLNGLHFN